MNEKKAFMSCKEIMSKNNDIEQVLKYLKDNGFSKIESMKIICELTDVDLGKSKEIVHLSKTWSDSFSNDESFLDAIESSFINDK